MSCPWLEGCPLRRLEKENKISEKWKNEYCLSSNNFKNCQRYQMEKEGEPHKNILPNGEKIKCLN